MAKAFIHWAGDPSVGIWGGSFEIDFYSPIDDIADHFEGGRDELRQELATFFGERIIGERVGVQFDDECADCQSLMCKVDGDEDKCSNTGCISNVEVEEVVLGILGKEGQC